MFSVCDSSIQLEIETNTRLFERLFKTKTDLTYLVRWPKSVTAISISPRQFQLRSRQFQFHHGNFNFTTAISTSFTAISISSSLASLSLSLTLFSGPFWPFKMNDMAEKFEIQISKPKNNLPPAERKALKDLKNNTEINIKKADKGTTSIFMSLADKKTEGKIQLDNIEHYRPLDESMVEETSVRVEQLITELYREQHIDEMAKKWLCQTQNAPRIPVFYTLTKIHKLTPVGRPIVSGVSGTTERLSAFVDELLQPIEQQQKSYLHSWTLWFIKATDSLPNQCSIFSHTHYKATETFQYTHFSSCHPPGVKRGFIKGEALRLLRTNSTKATFEEKIRHFESRLIERGYPKNLVQRTLSEVIFENRKQALQQKPHTNKTILPFVTQCHPSVVLTQLT